MGRRRKTQQEPSKTTADHLARAVYDDLIPEHRQTCEDYGFDRAISPKEKSNLLGLYIGLIKIMEISPKTIHNWRVRGVLVDEIKAAFSKIPERARGAYFPWFLQNQHIIALAGKPLSAKEMRDNQDAMLQRTWQFTGESEKDSPQAIRAAIERKSVEEQKCYTLYTLLLSMWSPSPNLDLWVDFGFASCTSEAEEGMLGGQYQRLITLCTFKEFYNAYRNCRLLDLFHSKGLQVKDSPQLRDLLLVNRWRKSVWSLKQFVIQEASVDGESSMVPSIAVDYGFINCKNVSEMNQLKKVYKDFFTTHHGDPLALHEACIKGALHTFLSGIIQGLQLPRYRRLMTNPYPLPDLDEPGESLPSGNDDGNVQTDETSHAPSLPDQVLSNKFLSDDNGDDRIRGDETRQAPSPPDLVVSSKSLSGDNDDNKVRGDETRQVPSLPDLGVSGESLPNDYDGGKVQTYMPAHAPPVLHVSSAIFFVSGTLFGAALAVLCMQVRSS